jgi:hypothetical protein
MRRSSWQQAGTLAELGELTARWLEGCETWQPGYDGGPDEETRELVPVLAPLCRAGFVTNFSQPGGTWTHRRGRAWVQRAAVSGFCSEQTWDRLMAGLEPQLVRHDTAGGDRPLDLAAWHPDWIDMADGGEPITRVGRRLHTWVGRPMPTAYLRQTYTQVGPVRLGPAGLAALLGAHQVSVWDRRWGCADGQLWTVLAAALIGEEVTTCG